MAHDERPPRQDGKAGENVSIPDEDMAGWMQTLREGNYTDAEIEAILSDHNAAYYEQKLSKDAKDQFERTLKGLEARRGKALSADERVKLLEAYRLHRERTNP